MVYAGTAWAAGLIAAAFSGHLYIAVPAALISALLFKVLFRFNLKAIIFMLVVYFMAFCYYGAYNSTVYKNIIDFAGQEINFSGVVTDYKDYAENKSTYFLKGKINGLQQAQIIIYTDASDCDVGDKISLKCIPELPENSYLFSGLDYYKSDGIYLQSDDVSLMEIKKTSGFSLRKMLYKFRENVSGAIDSSVPSDESGMLKGMLFGDKSGIDQNDKTMLYRTGIGHVTAVSGLHIVLFCTLITFLLRKFGTSKLLEFAISEIFMILFALCCGMSPSIMRAFVMMTLVNSAPLFFRYTDSLNSVCISVILLTLFNPFMIINQSFLLSVSGALGAGVFGPYMTGNLNSFGRLNKTRNNILYMLCVSAAVTPMSVICFGEFSAIAPLSNLIITPLCMLSLLIAMIASMLIFINPILLFKISGAICRIVLNLSRLIGKNKFTHTKLIGDFIPAVMIIILIFCISAYLIFKSRKYSAITAVVSAALLFFTCVFYNYYSATVIKIALLGKNDVGVIIVSKGYAADIIDITGKASNSRYAEKYLENCGITEINNLIITDNAYHAVSAYNDKLSLCNVKNVVIPSDTYMRNGSKICRKTPKYSDYSSWNAYYEAYSVSIVNMRVEVKFMDFLFEFTDGKSGNKVYKTNILLTARSDGTMNYRRLENG